MENELYILFVEDSPEDADLEQRLLNQAGLTFQSRRVDRQNEFIEVLEKGPLSLIVCDYTLPGFDGRLALEIARQIRPEVPFLFVSGTIGEEIAVECLKNGATDYILKDRMGSLAERVRRALQEAAERKAREEIEAQLRQSQRVQSLGRLAGGLAHELNNFLMVIGGRAELLRPRVRGDVEASESIDQIAQSVQRATGLIRRLLAFARHQPVQRSRLNLSRFLPTIEPLLESVLDEDVRLAFDLDPVLGEAMLDEGHMHQVVMNLAINACDAMPRGGTLTFTTRNVELDEAFVRSHEGVLPGPHVALSVTDTGDGIDPAAIERIFEPFFTTKGPDKGTGLGLSVVHGIVEQNGGTIAVASRVGKGAVFTLYFPRVAGGPVPEPPVAGPRGGGTILVVDDNDPVRGLVAEILAGQGYEILEASDGLHALEVAESHGKAIDLLLTDVWMPELDGPGLVQRLGAARAGLKVLFMSGHAEAEDLDGENGAPLIQKPFTPENLLRAVRDALEEAPRLKT